MFIGISEFMYFVSNRMEAAQWYAKLFDTEIISLDDPNLFFLRVGSFEGWEPGDLVSCRRQEDTGRWRGSSRL